MRLFIAAMAVLAVTYTSAQEPAGPAEGLAVTKEGVARAWSITSAPHKDGRYFYCQRSFDKDGTIKGFVSCREHTDKPKYKEIGRILILGTWSVEGDQLTTEVLRYIPAHDELPGGKQVWTIKKLTKDTLELARDKKQVTLTTAKVGDDPNRTGSDIVQFYKDKVPDIGL